MTHNDIAAGKAEASDAAKSIGEFFVFWHLSGDFMRSWCTLLRDELAEADFFADAIAEQLVRGALDEAAQSACGRELTFRERRLIEGLADRLMDALHAEIRDFTLTTAQNAAFTALRNMPLPDLPSRASAGPPGSPNGGAIK